MTNNPAHSLPQALANRKTFPVGNLPDVLKTHGQFTCFKTFPRKDGSGKLNKAPCDPETTRLISKTDRGNWLTFAAAVDHAKANQYIKGIGFCLSKDDPFTIVDLDRCVDPATGKIEAWAQQIIDRLASYAEVSLSLTGVHIVVFGTVRGRNRFVLDSHEIEVYDRASFIALTGYQIDGTPGAVTNGQDVLDEWADAYPDVLPTTNPTPTVTVDLTNDELIEKARNARNGDEFKRLHDHGDISDFDSHSNARFRHLQIAAFWTGWDAERMSAWYEASALYNIEFPKYAHKWARLGARECQRAIAATPRAYRQPAKTSKVDGGELAPIIDALKAYASGLAWEGRSGPTDRHVFDALVRTAERYGSVAKRGIIVSASTRDLALEAGVNRNTILKALDRLSDKDQRDLIRLQKKSTRGRGAAYLIKYPPRSRVDHNTCVYYGPPLSALRNRAPTPQREFDKNGRKLYVDNRFWLQRLGKLSALLIEKIANAPENGLTLGQLANALDRRARNLARPGGPLARLLDAGLVLQDDHGHYHTPKDLDERLDIELTESGCYDARKRDERKYALQRDAYHKRDQVEPDEAPAEDAVARERTLKALGAFEHEGSGPNKAANTYYDGDSFTFSYVIGAVAYYLTGHLSEEQYYTWEMPVRRAYALYFGEPADAADPAIRLDDPKPPLTPEEKRERAGELKPPNEQDDLDSILPK